MVNKIVLTAAIIATLIATVCVAAQEMANAEHSELLMKLMAFISLIIFDQILFGLNNDHQKYD